jgi:hypothetical protein
VRKECRNYWTGILLENFWCKAILGVQFALLLFLRGLMSSILSFCYRTKFCGKETFGEKCRPGYYCALRTFCGNPLG